MSNNRKEQLLATLVFLGELALGIYLGYNGILLGEAQKLTANAFYVFNTLPHRLGSIGLDTQPLPAAVQLPFILLAKLWRPVITMGISGAFTSALFQAMAAKTIYNCFHQLKCRELDALLITLLYVLNPYVLFYGANGMTEIMIAAAGVQILCSLTLWMRKGRPQYLIFIAFSFVLMFLTDKKALPFALVIAFCIVINILNSKREKRYYSGEGLEKVWYTEASLWVTFLPLLFSLFCWSLYNASMTGKPFYFVNSGYSLMTNSVYKDYGGFFPAVGYIMTRARPFLIPLAAILISRIFTGNLVRYDTLIIILGSLGITFFTTFMVLTGNSAGTVRAFCYPLMFSTAFIPYVLRIAGEKRSLVLGLTAAGLAAAAVFLGWSFLYSADFREDLLINVPARSGDLAEYLNVHCADGKILMDTHRTYYAIMNTDHPETLIINPSPDFWDAIADPVGHDVHYVVVSSVSESGKTDALNISWPNLYTGGEEWAKEMESIGEFKVFKVMR